MSQEEHGGEGLALCRGVQGLVPLWAGSCATLGWKSSSATTSAEDQLALAGWSSCWSAAALKISQFVLAASDCATVGRVVF